GRPLAGAVVIATGREQAANAFGSSDQDGRFSLSGLAPGSYTLRIQDRANLSQAYEREVQLEGDLDLDLDFAAVEVTGQVTDRASGAPLAGAEVRLVATSGEVARLAGLGHGPQTVTDDAGRFRFTGVATGDYRVRAERDGYATAEVALSLADGPATGGVELALEPTRGLALRVLSSHGTLPERVMVAALPPGDPPVGSVLNPVFAASVTPGEEGRLVLDRLPAGSWRLIVAGDGLAAVERRVTAPGPEVAVALPAAASLDLAVASLVDTGTYGSARLRGADGSVWIGVDASGQPRADWPLFGGRTRVDHLPAGAWSVEITTPEGPPLSGRVETAAGSASQLRIE
ncbi:MAG TPA: carboxypeptidase-like regulatory domain-containing protein, partial [Thermoanaerobaculia bacterium]|nr:carboxypeptidase-like regulatory domain-containing protein [Thermoanaerobaculia bacterium]